VILLLKDEHHRCKTHTNVDRLCKESWIQGFSDSRRNPGEWDCHLCLE